MLRVDRLQAYIPVRGVLCRATPGVGSGVRVLVLSAGFCKKNIKKKYLF
jgi:hypothetical protein